MGCQAKRAALHAGRKAGLLCPLPALCATRRPAAPRPDLPSSLPAPAPKFPAAIVAMPAGNWSESLVAGQRALETEAGPVAYPEALAACREAVSACLPRWWRAACRQPWRK